VALVRTDIPLNLWFLQVPHGIISQKMAFFNAGFDITDQLFIRYWRRNGITMKYHISYSQTSKKTMIQLGGKYYIIFSQN
jgi:hypothetical protein